MSGYGFEEDYDFDLDEEELESSAEKPKAKKQQSASNRPTTYGRRSSYDDEDEDDEEDESDLSGSDSLDLGPVGRQAAGAKAARPGTQPARSSVNTSGASGMSLEERVAARLASLDAQRARLSTPTGTADVSVASVGSAGGVPGGRLQTAGLGQAVSQGLLAINTSGLGRGSAPGSTAGTPTRGISGRPVITASSRHDSDDEDDDDEEEDDEEDDEDEDDEDDSEGLDETPEDLGPLRSGNTSLNASRGTYGAANVSGAGGYGTRRPALTSPLSPDGEDGLDTSSDLSSGDFTVKSTSIQAMQARRAAISASLNTTAASAGADSVGSGARFGTGLTTAGSRASMGTAGSGPGLARPGSSAGLTSGGSVHVAPGVAAALGSLLGDAKGPAMPGAGHQRRASGGSYGLSNSVIGAEEVEEEQDEEDEDDDEDLSDVSDGQPGHRFSAPARPQSFRAGAAVPPRQSSAFPSDSEDGDEDEQEHSGSTGQGSDGYEDDTFDGDGPAGINSSGLTGKVAVAPAPAPAPAPSSSPPKRGLSFAEMAAMLRQAVSQPASAILAGAPSPAPALLSVVAAATAAAKEAKEREKDVTAAVPSTGLATGYSTSSSVDGDGSSVHVARRSEVSQAAPGSTGTAASAWPTAASGSSASGQVFTTAYPSASSAVVPGVHSSLPPTAPGTPALQPMGMGMGMDQAVVMGQAVIDPAALLAALAQAVPGPMAFGPQAMTAGASTSASAEPASSAAGRVAASGLAASLRAAAAAALSRAVKTATETQREVAQALPVDSSGSAADTTRDSQGSSQDSQAHAEGGHGAEAHSDQGASDQENRDTAEARHRSKDKRRSSSRHGHSRSRSRRHHRSSSQKRSHRRSHTDMHARSGSDESSRSRSSSHSDRSAYSSSSSDRHGRRRHRHRSPGPEQTVQVGPGKATRGTGMVDAVAQTSRPASTIQHSRRPSGVSGASAMRPGSVQPPAVPAMLPGSVHASQPGSRSGSAPRAGQAHAMPHSQPAHRSSVAGRSRASSVGSAGSAGSYARRQATGHTAAAGNRDEAQLQRTFAHLEAMGQVQSRYLPPPVPDAGSVHSRTTRSTVPVMPSQRAALQARLTGPGQSTRGRGTTRSQRATMSAAETKARAEATARFLAGGAGAIMDAVAARRARAAQDRPLVTRAQARQEVDRHGQAILGHALDATDGSPVVMAQAEQSVEALEQDERIVGHESAHDDQDQDMDQADAASLPPMSVHGDGDEQQGQQIGVTHSAAAAQSTARAPSRSSHRSLPTARSRTSSLARDLPVEIFVPEDKARQRAGSQASHRGHDNVHSRPASVLGGLSTGSAGAVSSRGKSPSLAQAAASAGVFTGGSSRAATPPPPPPPATEAPADKAVVEQDIHEHAAPEPVPSRPQPAPRPARLSDDEVHLLLDSTAGAGQGQTLAAGTRRVASTGLAVGSTRGRPVLVVRPPAPPTPLPASPREEVARAEPPAPVMQAPAQPMAWQPEARVRSDSVHSAGSQDSVESIPPPPPPAAVSLAPPVLTVPAIGHVQAESPRPVSVAQVPALHSQRSVSSSLLSGGAARGPSPRLEAATPVPVPEPGPVPVTTPAATADGLQATPGLARVAQLESAVQQLAARLEGAERLAAGAVSTAGTSDASVQAAPVLTPLPSPQASSVPAPTPVPMSIPAGPGPLTESMGGLPSFREALLRLLVLRPREGGTLSNGAAMPASQVLDSSTLAAALDTSPAGPFSSSSPSSVSGIPSSDAPGGYFDDVSSAQLASITAGRGYVGYVPLGLVEAMAGQLASTERMLQALRDRARAQAGLDRMMVQEEGVQTESVEEGGPSTAPPAPWPVDLDLTGPLPDTTEESHAALGTARQELSSLQAKVAWYRDNQALIDADIATLAQQKDTIAGQAETIARLQEQLSQAQAQAQAQTRAATAAVPPAKGSPASKSPQSNHSSPKTPRTGLTGKGSGSPTGGMAGPAQAELVAELDRLRAASTTAQASHDRALRTLRQEFEKHKAAAEGYRQAQGQLEGRLRERVAELAQKLRDAGQEPGAGVEDEVRDSTGQAADAGVAGMTSSLARGSSVRAGGRATTPSTPSRTAAGAAGARAGATTRPPASPSPGPAAAKATSSKPGSGPARTSVSQARRPSTASSASSVSSAGAKAKTTRPGTGKAGAVTPSRTATGKESVAASKAPGPAGSSPGPRATSPTSAKAAAAPAATPGAGQSLDAPSVPSLLAQVARLESELSSLRQAQASGGLGGLVAGTSPSSPLAQQSPVVSAEAKAAAQQEEAKRAADAAELASLRAAQAKSAQAKAVADMLATMKPPNAWAAAARARQEELMRQVESLQGAIALLEARAAMRETELAAAEAKANQALSASEAIMRAQLEGVIATKDAALREARGQVQALVRQLQILVGGQQALDSSSRSAPAPAEPGPMGSPAFSLAGSAASGRPGAGPKDSWGAGAGGGMMAGGSPGIGLAAR